jgi:hypothetical protein
MGPIVAPGYIAGKIALGSGQFNHKNLGIIVL